MLALVTLGLGLSKIQNSTIDRHVLSAMHGFWDYAMYFSETLIFIAIGLFTGHELKSSNHEWAYADAAYIVVFFLFTILARFVAIWVFYYPLSKLGYGLDWKKYIVLSYGGLRGSHSLILGLMLDSKKYPEVIRDKVIVYTGGVVLLSLIIQAPMFQYVLGCVRLIKRKNISEQLRLQIERKLMVSYEIIVDQLKQKKEFIYCDWDEVHKLLEVDKQMKEIKSGTDIAKKKAVQAPQTYTPLQRHEYLKEFRVRILNSLKAYTQIQFDSHYLHQYPYYVLNEVFDNEIDMIQHEDQGEHHRKVVPIDGCKLDLKSSFEQKSKIVIERTNGELNIWIHLRHYFISRASLELLRYFKGFPIVGRIVFLYIQKRLSELHEISQSFVDNLYQIERELESDKLPGYLEQYKNKILEEIKDNKLEAQIYIT